MTNTITKMYGVLSMATICQSMISDITEYKYYFNIIHLEITIVIIKVDIL